MCALCMQSDEFLNVEAGDACCNHCTFKGYSRRILCVHSYVLTALIFFLSGNMFVGSVMKKGAENKLAVYSFYVRRFIILPLCMLVRKKALLAAFYCNLWLGVL